MSLIEEALRRAQEAQTSQKPTTPAPRLAAPLATEPSVDAPTAPTLTLPDDRLSTLPPPPPGPHPVWMGLTALWAALALVAVVSVSAVLWVYRMRLISQPIMVSLPSPTQRSATPQNAARPAGSATTVSADSSSGHGANSAQAAPPAFVLNGVVEGVGEPFAIINGTIVRLGEVVNGATLVEVGDNRARLRRASTSEDVVLRTAN